MYTDHCYCKAMFYVKFMIKSSQVGNFHKFLKGIYIGNSDWSSLSRFLSVTARQGFFSATARFSLV